MNLPSPPTPLPRAGEGSERLRWPQAWTLRISDRVLEKASRGDSHAAALRIDALRGIEAWPITPDAETLATRLIE